MTRGGLPHSDIFGSKLVCSSPKLFAACHVLHRLLAPRHSPYTLSSLTIKLKTDAHQSFACRLVCDSFFRNTACVCGRKKLPCAEYSVVKDQILPDSAGNLLTSGGSGAPPEQRSTNHRPTSVCARPTASLAHRNFSKSASSYDADNPNLACCPPSRYGAQPLLSWLANRSSSVSSERRLVENTGLEPVTSWLQTRRSPS
jgi:hypothetical protein